MVWRSREIPQDVGPDVDGLVVDLEHGAETLSKAQPNSIAAVDVGTTLVHQIPANFKVGASDGRALERGHNCHHEDRCMFLQSCSSLLVELSSRGFLAVLKDAKMECTEQWPQRGFCRA